MGLAEEIQKLEELYKKDSVISDEKKKKRDQILRKIKTGHSTGDPLTDLLFVIDRPFDSEIRKLFEKFEKKIGQSLGEPLLIEAQQLNDRGSRITVGLTLGIIQNPATYPIVRYDIQNTRILIPTEGIHATKVKQYCGLDWSLEESKINLQKLRKKANLPEKENTEEQHAIHHSEWSFNTTKNYKTDNVMTIPFEYVLYLYKRAGIVEDKYPMPNEKKGNEFGLFFHIGKKQIDDYFSMPTLDSSYVNACKKLKLTPAAKFQKAYDQKVAETKKSVLGIIEQRLGLPKGERDNGALRAILRSAIHLKMHEDPTEIKPAPGVVVNMGEYITGLCNLYQLEIPK